MCPVSVLSHVIGPNQKAIPGIKNILAVASGKGGVGKSTIAVNLALGLAEQGAKVGLLDADIYGPSQPTMLGVSSDYRAEVDEHKKLVPVLAHGLKTMSIGYLIDAKTPAIWRGPMVSSALQQLLFETTWGELDYLIMDLPPGTGDIQLTMAQKCPITAAIIVTTPQDIACLDAIKGLKMFQKVGVAVLGVVENMSGHSCSACGHHDPIFGEGGGENMAVAEQVPLLAKIPLDRKIRQQADSGQPVSVGYYIKLAENVASELAKLPVNYQAGIPKIVMVE
jgi:ATP-binding protein involved in chromosome partitioning